MSRFAAIPALALEDQRISLRDICTLGILATFSDKEGWCYPAAGKMAEMAGIARTGIVKSLNRLIDLGYVEKKARFRVDGSQTSNIYRILYDYIPPQKHRRMQPDIDRGVPSEDTPPVLPEDTPSVPSEGTPINTPVNTTREQGEATTKKGDPKWTPPDWVNQTAWSEFEQHRKAHKSKFTDLARTKAANLLKGLSPEQQQQVIDYSIQAGYPGLYPERLENRKPRSRPHTAQGTADVYQAYLSAFGKPPPVGKTTEECWSLIQRKREKQPQWYDA